jgi:hypothetical protein
MKDLYISRNTRNTRYSSEIKKSEHSSISFAMHRKKPYDFLVWKSF